MFRLWYVDMEIHFELMGIGTEEMRVDTKQLYSYHMKDGDGITI